MSRSYESSEGNLGLPVRQSEEPEASAVSGTGPNPNASGAVAREVESRYARRFDDNYDRDGGEGQIHSSGNDGYPYPDGWAVQPNNPFNK